MVEYNKRLVEVDTILKYLSPENYNKIPQDIINAIKENMDKDYTWEYDEEKEFAEQDLNIDTVAILSYINNEYLLNEEQKAYMEKIYEENEQKELQKQYEGQNDYSYLFDRKNKTIENEEEKTQETAVTVYKESVFKRFWNKLKSFFSK